MKVSNAILMTAVFSFWMTLFGYKEGKYQANRWWQHNTLTVASVTDTEHFTWYKPDDVPTHIYGPVEDKATTANNLGVMRTKWIGRRLADYPPGKPIEPEPFINQEPLGQGTIQITDDAHGSYFDGTTCKTITVTSNGQSWNATDCGPNN